MVCLRLVRSSARNGGWLCLNRCATLPETVRGSALITDWPRLKRCALLPETAAGSALSGGADAVRSYVLTSGRLHPFRRSSNGALLCPKQRPAPPETAGYAMGAVVPPGCPTRMLSWPVTAKRQVL